MWLPMSDVFDLGVPGPSGNENDTYVSNDIIYKVNNLLNTGSILRLLDRLTWHNNLFYDTAYTLHAFTGFDGRDFLTVRPSGTCRCYGPCAIILKQSRLTACSTLHPR